MPLAIASPRRSLRRYAVDRCPRRLAPEPGLKVCRVALLIRRDVLIALLLPWVHNAARFAVGDVEFLPYADALNSLPHEQAVALERYAGMYVSGETVSDAIAQLRQLRAGREAPDADLRALVGKIREPSHLEPLIVLVSTRVAVDHALRAVECLMFATIIENGVYYATSVTFRVEGYDLARETGGITEVRPRMHGRVISGLDVATRIVVRPEHAETYHSNADLEFAAALLNAVELPKGRYLVEALAALRLAMNDSPDVTQALQHSLFAKAATLAIWKRGLKKDTVTALRPRVDDLLGPFFQRRRRYGSKATLRGPAWIRKAWIAVRSERNNFWHPRHRKNRAKFSQQRLVTPMMIALRTVYALTLARLAEIGTLRSDSRLRADVPAIAEWIASLGPDLERGLAVPELRSDDPEERRRWALSSVDWNEAAREANNWGRFRAEERMQAGLSATLRELRRERSKR